MNEEVEPKNPCMYIGLGCSCAYYAKHIANGGRGRDLIPLHLPMVNGVCQIATSTPEEQKQQCVAFKEGPPREITYYSKGPRLDSFTIDLPSLLEEVSRG